MEDRPRILGVVGFVLLAVASCAPRESTVPSVPPSPFPSPALVLPSPTAPMPTETPGPESQIVFAAEPPAWLREAATNVLAVIIGDATPCRETGTYLLRFVNAETGEQFEMTVPPARAMMWLDPMTFGLLSMDGQTIVSIDLADGSVGRTTFAAEGIRLLEGAEEFDPEEFECTMRPLDIVRDDPSGEEGLVFVSALRLDSPYVYVEPLMRTPRSSYSADLSYFADFAGNGIDVREVGTGVPVWTSDAREDSPDIAEQGFAWSPLDPTHLAVVQCDYQGTPDCVDQRLFIVDVVRGEELASYVGNFVEHGYVGWSPHGNQILYQRPQGGWAEADWIGGPPCVLDVGTGRTECMEELALAHFAEDLHITYPRVEDLQWDRGGVGFFYEFSGVRLLANDQGTSETPVAVQGVCHFDIATRGVSCPSWDLPEFQNADVAVYQFSPDEAFAYVLIRSESIIHGVLDLANGRLSRLPDPRTEDFFPYSVVRVWRPLPTRAAQ